MRGAIKELARDMQMATALTHMEKKAKANEGQVLKADPGELLHELLLDCVGQKEGIDDELDVSMLSGEEAASASSASLSSRCKTLANMLSGNGKAPGAGRGQKQYGKSGKGQNWEDGGNNKKGKSKGKGAKNKGNKKGKGGQSVPKPGVVPWQSSRRL